MSITSSPLNLLTTKFPPCSRMQTHAYTPPQISANGYLSLFPATATCGLTQRIQLRSRCSVRTKAGRSHGEPQDTPDTKAEDPSTTTNQGSSSSILSFLCPLLKFVGGKDPSLPRKDIFEVVTSGLASISRLPWGSQAFPDVVIVREEKGWPMRLLQLYEFEACPFCRRVREALTELDLPAEVYPCPKGSLKHRDVVRRSGGKEQFPYLVDPNTGVSLYESGDIVKYLFGQYGGGRDPSLGLLERSLGKANLSKRNIF